MSKRQNVTQILANRPKSNPLSDMKLVLEEFATLCSECIVCGDHTYNYSICREPCSKIYLDEIYEKNMKEIEENRRSHPGTYEIEVLSAEELAMIVEDMYPELCNGEVCMT